MIRLIVIMLMEIMTSYLYCQMPNNNIDRAITKTVLIKYKNANGSGSGFALFNKTSTFIISAKHVFVNNMSLNNKYNAVDSILFIILYSQDYLQGIPDTIEINLNEAFRSNYFQFDNLNDIAVLKIGKISNLVDKKGITTYLPFVKKVSNRLQLNGFPVTDIIPFDSIYLGNEVFIVGYPKSLELKNINQYEFNRPLIRKGVLAGKSLNFNTIIIDCPVYNGNSGGPVLYVKREIQKDKYIETYPLLGVISQFIPYEEKWSNASYNLTNTQWENSGYSVIVPIENVLYFIKAHF